MLLLAVDTSTPRLGIALFDGTEVLAESSWTSAGNHTVELAPSVAQLLRRSSMTADSIGALGVALGPGSFTSLRVGLAFCKGLALARSIPLVGIPSLDIVAGGQAASRLQLAAVLQAGRGRLAVGWYRWKRGRWQADGEPVLASADSLAESIKQPTLIVGDLTAPERQRLARKRVNVTLASPSQAMRRPAVLAELAWERWRSHSLDNLASLAPKYLHLSEPAAS